MPAKHPPGSLTVAIAFLGGLLVAGTLAAQDPASPKPTPISPTVPFPAPQPSGKEPPPERTAIDPRVLDKPDLQVTLSPNSMNAAPTRFTVENIGSENADRASLLRVSVRILPLEEGVALGGTGGIVGAFDELGGLGGLRTSEDVPLGSRAGGLGAGDLEELCAAPLDDFEAAIDPLDEGESQVFSQSGSRVGGGVREVGLVGARPETRIPTHSYVRRIEVRLVCVYELTATADANAEILERNERNNQVVHLFQREVTLR